ncbi:MAG: hypothetical protein AB7E85_08245 [Pseudobdellovibrionaceae bacterium]
MQTVLAYFPDGERHLIMPSANQELLPNVKWGNFDQLFTPAFWRAQAWQHEILGTYQDFMLIALNHFKMNLMKCASRQKKIENRLMN